MRSWGPAALILYDVTALYYEAHEGDGFRESGFSKERRLEPQITVGLLTDASGFPLRVEAFEGNKAEQATMLPTLEAFTTAYVVENVTVVADAGMVSEKNKKDIDRAGLEQKARALAGIKGHEIDAAVPLEHDATEVVAAIKTRAAGH